MLELNATAIAVILNFIILVWILNYFLYKPVLKILQDRKKYVDTLLEDAEKDRERTQKIKNEYEEKLKNADEERRKIIEQAQLFSEKIKRDATLAAKIDATQIRDRVARDAEKMRKETFIKLKTEIGYLAALIASKILKRTIDEKDHTRLIDDFTQKLGGSNFN